MENATKPCMKITLTDKKPTVFESKIGGMGYIPHDKEFPKDKDGRQLRLLAQIDLSCIQLEEFTGKGLLQFWISEDDLYGCDFDNPTLQDGFRVIYYPEPDPTVTEEEIKSKYIPGEDEIFSPVGKECGMSFEKSENTYIDIESYDEPDDEIIELYGKNAGHKVGGFPYFTQYDPRYKDELKKYDYLLFQLDSEFRNHEDLVLWGDSGICNFFISSENLKNLDFSDVLYNWDCL